MIQFARKKGIRNDRIMQLILFLGLLRGSSDLLCDYVEQSQFPAYQDFPIGTSFGAEQISSSFFAQDIHPKSMDRILAHYQQSVLDDLNHLGNFEALELLGRFQLPQQDIHSYLLNAESSLTPPPQSPEEGGYASALPSPVAIEQPLLWENVNTDHFDINMDTNSHLSNEDNMQNIFEDLDLLETIWKQDVDLGVPRDIFDSDEAQAELEEISSKFGIDLNFTGSASKDDDPEKKPGGSSEKFEWAEEKDYATLNLTIDSETGEILASDSARSSSPGLEGEGPVLSGAETQNTQNQVPTSSSTQLLNDENLHLEFNLDEALRFVGLDSAEEPQEGKDSPKSQGCESDSGCGESNNSDCGDLDALNETLDEMIQASQLHPHHPRNFQGRLGGLVRSGSMEQRWQDLASLLSLPSPDPNHPSPPTMATSPQHHPQPPPNPPIHHPHALYPPPQHEGAALGSSPRGVLIHNAAPPMPDAHITYTNSMGASSHLVASSMNLANNSEIATTEHHHYKMESSSTMSQDNMMYYQTTPGSEMPQSTDGFLSSILNDEDLAQGLMDIPMADYNGRGGNGDYGAAYRYPPPEDPHRLPPVAQKKHQMFGKRFFHENPHGPAPNNLPPAGTNVGIPIGSYPPHYAPPQTNPPMEGATAMDPSEMKYSCSMDFRSPEAANAAVEHVQHNHTYHMSPEGPSGLSRPHARDKRGRKSDNEKSLSRDEKRARGMNLPITCEDIINLPMDEFNERISKYDLTEAQLSLIRDIRRRGKNKVAAQNCRKRKLDQIVHLAEEVKVIHYRKSELHSQLDHLTAERGRIKHKFSLLYRHIFQSLRDPEGNPYSPHDYSLQQSADGSILLVPRSSPPPHHMDKGRHPKDDRGH